MHRNLIFIKVIVSKRTLKNIMSYHLVTLTAELKTVILTWTIIFWLINNLQKNKYSSIIRMRNCLLIFSEAQAKVHFCKTHKILSSSVFMRIKFLYIHKSLGQGVMTNFLCMYLSLLKQRLQLICKRSMRYSKNMNLLYGLMFVLVDKRKLLNNVSTKTIICNFWML